MKNSSYRRILYFIGVVIFITLGIQIYWNFRNYEIGKQQLVNDVQISLDNAVEEYYASNAQTRTRLTIQNLSFPRREISPADSSGLASKFIYIDSSTRVKDHPKNRNIHVNKFDTLKLGERTSYSTLTEKGFSNFREFEDITVLRTDTTYRELESMVGKIIYSMGRDTLDLQKIDSLLRIHLIRKDLGVDFGLVFKLQNDNLEQRSNKKILETASLNTASRSAWLPRHSSLSVHFTNGTATILKQNLFGIILSSILLASVIGCLLFLLKIINNQKQLAEIKNDFISNLTHEFKTPIATIKVALEGMLLFNKNNDPEKTAKYVKTSNDQLEKLNSMVEKLLEVATLNSSQLQLEKENVELVQVLEMITKKYQAMAPEKSFQFSSDQEEIQVVADPFHLENAFNNILDNAVKYGGEKISVSVTGRMEDVEIIIGDSGNTLTKVQASQIFDKFYRVPKGNTHDVKGFGIGLYYTRQIIERHGGKINVEVGDHTNFIINLLYE